MTTRSVGSQNPVQNCLNGIQQGFYSIQNKILSLCSTDNKIYAFLIIGRTLQAAALLSLASSATFTFVVGPVALLATIPSIAIGILGTYIAGNPHEINDFLQMSLPFVPGQPVGLINSGSDCWLNASLQLLANTPSFHERLRQIPEFSRFLDGYVAARNSHQKVATNVDIHAIRRFLSRETNGQIADGYTQEDAAQLFEYLFQGQRAIHRLEQQLDGNASVLRYEPMIQIDLGGTPRQPFQQLFNNYFDYRSQTGHHIQLFFPNAPNELLVQAKRFYQQINPADGSLQQGKIADPIDVSERLTLPRHFVRTNETSEYICDRFLIHHGLSVESGHYTSYIKMGNTWWYSSDSVQYAVPANEALSAMKNGLIFHYRKAQ